MHEVVSLHFIIYNFIKYWYWTKQKRPSQKQYEITLMGGGKHPS